MALTPRDKRVLMILGAAAVVALIYVFVFVLGGGEERQRAAPPTGGTTATPSPEPTATPTPRDASAPVLTFTGRDPFSPPAAFVSPSAEASPSTTPPDDDGNGDGDGDGDGPNQQVGGKDVTLLSITTGGKVQIQVDGSTSGLLSEGDTFRGVTVDAIGTTCADFSIDGEDFTLCESTGK